jgi:hypothetical protein
VDARFISLELKSAISQIYKVKIRVLYNQSAVLFAHEVLGNGNAEGNIGKFSESMMMCPAKIDFLSERLVRGFVNDNRSSPCNIRFFCLNQNTVMNVVRNDNLAFSFGKSQCFKKVQILMKFD